MGPSPEGKYRLHVILLFLFTEVGSPTTTRRPERLYIPTAVCVCIQNPVSRIGYMHRGVLGELTCGVKAVSVKPDALLSSVSSIYE